MKLTVATLSFLWLLTLVAQLTAAQHPATPLKNDHQTLSLQRQSTNAVAFTCDNKIEIRSPTTGSLYRYNSFVRSIDVRPKVDCMNKNLVQEMNDYVKQADGSCDGDICGPLDSSVCTCSFLANFCRVTARDPIDAAFESGGVCDETLQRQSTNAVAFTCDNKIEIRSPTTGSLYRYNSFVRSIDVRPKVDCMNKNLVQEMNDYVKQADGSCDGDICGPLDSSVCTCSFLANFCRVTARDPIDAAFKSGGVCDETR